MLTTIDPTGKAAACGASPWRLRNGRAFAIALLLSAGACAAARPPDTASNRQAVDAAFQRWAAGGSGFFDEMLHEDVVWTIAGSGPSAVTYRGRQAFLDSAVAPFAARMAAPVRPVARQVWADADHVIVRWRGEGTAGDGRAYHNNYVWIFRMRGGRAIEATAFLDLPAYDDVLRRVAPRP
ncbi:nuclear transport factor 2 family protein [Pseudoduganella lutea]|uniref:Nuclear transport factor 2 family protein n=1 Tax=Pseudoduganella lutea TaxID=321985 RepID=A0A4P6KRP7_9BURK|nr:nuclear transport factor 2 family protein [Pseudoduganella lutea]QBE61771.1 nuclear transport factor 2 family protein [Pseudoduganella lutea]